MKPPSDAVLNVALLGGDAGVLPYLPVLSGERCWCLGQAVFVDAIAAPLLERFPGVRVLASGEELLAVEDLHAAIVVPSRPEVCEAAQQLAVAGCSLLLIPTVPADPSWPYVLSLSQEEAGGVLYPALVHRIHPVFARARQLMAGMEKQAVRLVEFERRCASSPGGLLQPEAIDRVILSDLDGLRWLLGEPQQVTALRTGVREQGFLAQTVTLSGERVPDAIWSARADAEQGGWECRISTERGLLRLTGDDDLSSVQLSVDGETQSAPAGFHPQRALWADFTKTVRTRTGGIPWDEFVRDCDLVEATRQSLRRRRTVDVHFAPTSERTVFKTRMITLGCGTLAYTLFAVMAYLLIAPLFRGKEMLLRIGMLFVFLPLAIFLVLQLFLGLARPATSPASTPGDDSGRAPSGADQG